jgi:uncharacterized membrane protein
MLRSEKKKRRFPALRKHIRFLVFLCAWGYVLFLLHASTLDYFLIRTSDLGMARYCATLGLSSCHKTLLSYFSDVGNGYPISEIGLAYFSFFGITLVFQSLEALRKPMALLGSIVSVMLLGILFFHLHSFCVHCLIIHALNLGVSGMTLFRYRSSPLTPFPRLKEWAISGIAGVAVSVIFVLNYDFYVIRGIRSELGNGRSRDFQKVGGIEEKELMRLRETSVPLYPSQQLQSDSPTIFLFFDFQCPYCKEALLTYETFRESTGKTIDIRIIPYPLEKSCNRTYSGEDYSGSCLAAWVFQCLVKEHQWKEYHEYLLRDAGLFSGDSKILSTIFWGGRSVRQIIDKCPIDLGDLLKELKAYSELSEESSILGTPVFLKPGLKTQSGVSLFLLEGVINVEGWRKVFELK